VNGICVVAALFGAPDPEQAAQDLSAVWSSAAPDAVPTSAAVSMNRG